MSNPAAADRPATFFEVMGSREFRSLFLASALSWFGDNAARAAVTAMVLQLTGSMGLSGAAFAISFLPWFGPGAVLTTIVDRYPYRRAMIVCDVVRMGTMALIAIPGMPVLGIIAMLFLTALLKPPFDAARSALVPQLLSGDRYVVGLSMLKTVGQAAVIAGYIVGSYLAVFDARIAVIFDALTFGISALLIRWGIRPRPTLAQPDRQTGLLRQTASGFAVVFRSPLLRAIAILMFLSVFFSILPEGLAAGWAADLTGNRHRRGLYQGIIMMASPAGFVLGGLVFTSVLAPSTRLKLIRPITFMTPLVLVPALFDPGIALIALMNGALGFCVAGLIPVTNALFVQALPRAYRARAFGVMQSGMMVFQGLAVFAGSVLADYFALHTVVGVWSLFGCVIMGFVARSWPSTERVHTMIDEARHNDATVGIDDRDETAPTGRTKQDASH
ncbi:MAG: MFS transporter [Micromonosporaceae bacterium]|nr:MFS transporter [Micromonosporaceae bacterium]